MNTEAFTDTRNLTMCCPADNAYEAWREENDRVIQQQAEEQQMYSEMHEASTQMNLAFDLAVFAHERARRIRETEGL